MADDSYFTSFSSEELEGGHTISRQPFLGVADFLKRNGFRGLLTPFARTTSQLARISKPSVLGRWLSLVSAVLQTRNSS